MRNHWCYGWQRSTLPRVAEHSTRHLLHGVRSAVQSSCPHEDAGTRRIGSVDAATWADCPPRGAIRGLSELG